MSARMNLSLTCASMDSERGYCGKPASSPCSNCYLVVYCDKDCQKQHWLLHKKDCKDALGKPTWLPAWHRAGRSPIWAPNAQMIGHNPFGGDMSLWGNVPAIDVLRLKDNEGTAWDKDLHILHAASGDLRNVAETIVSMPESFQKAIQVVINDRNIEVVARNSILLLYSLSTLCRLTKRMAESTSGLDLPATSLRHLWYSAFITPGLDEDLRSTVKPLILEALATLVEVSPDRYEKLWIFRAGLSFRLVLKMEYWLALRDYWGPADSLTFEQARKIRHDVVLAPSRADCRDRWLYKDHPPFVRIAKRKFRENGLLLSHGHPTKNYIIPNPLLFRSSVAWPMGDQSDPLNGWSPLQVSKWPWAAKMDIYGKLANFLDGKLTHFLQRLGKKDVHFRGFCEDARNLAPILEPVTFDRIEVSNITDAGYIGTSDTLRYLVPLLAPASVNPSATLIALYQNAVHDMATVRGDEDFNMEKVVKFIGRPSFEEIVNTEGAKMYKMWDARSLFWDVDAYFERYMKMQEFGGSRPVYGAVRKPQNSIVEPWPLRLRLEIEHPEAQDEFLLLLGSHFSSTEHYVEWRKEE